MCRAAPEEKGEGCRKCGRVQVHESLQALHGMPVSADRPQSKLPGAQVKAARCVHSAYDACTRSTLVVVGSTVRN